MANITRRQNKDGSTAYLIRVYVDETGTGKQITRSKTWKPAPGMRPSAAEKEAQKQAAIFEDQVKRGLVGMAGGIRFEDYARQWMEAAQLAPKTRESYEYLLLRINAAIGNIRLEKLQAHHLELFYKNLAEEGISERGGYAVSDKLRPLMRGLGLSHAKLAEISGVSAATIGAATQGKHIRIGSAERISIALGMTCRELFDIHQGEETLSAGTVHYYHRLICAILAKAKRERLVPFNVAQEHAAAPKMARKEARYLNDEQARRFLDLLMEEQDIRVKTTFILALFTGARRGELCGLSWPDIDETAQAIHIRRASQYQRGRGVVEVPTKTAGSVRTIKVPLLVMDILREYRKWWAEQRLKCGTAWKGEAQRILIQEDGTPINPDTVNFWLERFLKAHDLPHITPHSLRHTFATLQIAAGVDIRTLQARTGHSQASTLVNIYSHALQSAQEAASDALESVLLPSAKESRRG